MKIRVKSAKKGRYVSTKQYVIGENWVLVDANDKTIRRLLKAGILLQYGHEPKKEEIKNNTTAEMTVEIKENAKMDAVVKNVQEEKKKDKKKSQK